MSADDARHGVHDDVRSGSQEDGDQPPPGLESVGRPGAPDNPPEPAFAVRSRRGGEAWNSSTDEGSHGWSQWENDDRDFFSGARDEATQDEWHGSKWSYWDGGDTHLRGSGWDRSRHGDEHPAWDRRSSWDANASTAPGSATDHAWHPRDHDPWASGKDPWSKAWKNDDGFRARQDDWGNLRAAPQADGRDFRERDDDHDGVRDGAWSMARKNDKDGVAWNGWSHFPNGGFDARGARPQGQQAGGRASEKLTVPSFTGDDVDDVGGSARSYLRQVEAWRRMTYLPTSQQGLVLYQHLGGKAWIAAEELSLSRLGSNDGVSYLISWINARFLDLEVARIGRAFSDFFRRLRRKQGQTVREYNTEYDRLHARLREVGCSIPEECAAWLYIDRLALDESQELNLLASVGNTYNLHRLQQAAVLHDRGQRKPWETARGRRTHTPHVTDAPGGTLSDDEGSELEDGVPEDVAVAYATYQSAKERYKEQAKARGYHGERSGDKQKPKVNVMSSTCKPPAISSMNKTQLLAECTRLGLVVHRTWTVEELKAVIQEHRMENVAHHPGHQMKSVTSLNMPELKAKATEMGIDYPTNVTKGNLLRLIRDSLATPGSELMKIGKYKGFEFQEIPAAYGEWASKEVRCSSNPHVELVRFAKWWDNNQTTTYAGAKTSIEEHSVIPYPSSHTEESSVWGDYSDWGIARDEPKEATTMRGTYESGYKAPIRGNNKRSSAHTSVVEMDAETDPGTLAEIQALEARLAALKDKAKAVASHLWALPPQARPAIFEEDAYEHAGSQFGGETRVQKNGCCARDDGADCADAFVSAQELFLARSNQSTNLACAPCEDLDHDPFVQAMHDRDYTFNKIRQLLNNAGLKEVKTERGDVFGHTGAMANYNTLGLYTHGGTYGVTTRTKNQGSMVRYINEFARHHLGTEATWTSVTIAQNTETGIHHDYNNLQDSVNHVVSFAQRKGGGLWVEDKDLSQEDANKPGTQWRKDKCGRWMPGKVLDTKEKFVTFNPFYKRATEAWEGDRWCLIFHSTRNFVKIDDNLRKYLKNCGFPLPRRPRRQQAEARRKPTHSARKAIFNNAAKISVMMTTLLTAASTFLAATAYTDVQAEPVVMFEIGGTRGSEEAVSLGKDVFEPMDWKTYESPEGKEVAYHVINGGTPKELRINLDGKKHGCNEAIVDLMHQQVQEGGTVVVAGPAEDSLYYDENYIPFADKYLQYSNDEDGEKFMVFYQKKEEKHTVRGPDRVHQVCAVENNGGERAEEGGPAMDGSGITFGEGTPPMVASALRRLHQNLGHPQAGDMIRHLRLAGCDGPILKAARSLKCQVCDANIGPRIARPSVIPQLCDWNDTVGIDLFYAHDTNDVKHTFLSAVDYGQQAWWKNVWERLVYQLTIGEEEVDLAVPMVNAAKNDLRRRCGHSPSQWVFGRAPRIPEDLRDPDGGERITWDVSEDSKFQRQSAMRAAARIAFHRSQIDSRLRKAFLQRTLDGTSSDRGGSTPEEVGAYLSMKGTQKEVEKLLEHDPDGSDAFDQDDIDLDEEDLEDMDLDQEDDVVLEPALEEDELPMPTRRLKRKTNVARLDEPEGHEALMLKSDLTRRGIEKRKEKELKWSEIPDEVKHKFREAEQVQWDEHLSYDALQPLSTSESDAVRARIPADRILRCRWAYKDKNWAKRREGDVGAVWRCKSRLVIAGHTDPDLGCEHLSTDAPTLSRSGLACLMQLTANGLHNKDKWGLSAGDI
ncbi:GIP, partial [Symbiodinium sp. KB8]